MYKLGYTILFVSFLLINLNGQNTVFFDDVNSNLSNPWQTGGSLAGTPWNLTRSGLDWGGRRSGAMMLELTNDYSGVGAGNNIGWAKATYPTSMFSAPYNQVLKNNTAKITWTFNMRQPRTDPSGIEVAGGYGIAVALVTNNSTGYGVYLGQAGSVDKVRLSKFTGGIAGTITDLIVSNTPGLSDLGNEYLSIKVTYDPSNDSWELFLRNDGVWPFLNPASGTLVSQGTATDNTYTSVSYGEFSCYFKGNTDASQEAWFDNFKITIDCPLIRFVKAGGAGAMNGSSWSNASPNLQAMIDYPCAGQVWVAQGTYYPTSGSDRTISFQMKNGVEIYGGFPPTGSPLFAARNATLYPTILSGDIGTASVITDNSYRVIVNSGLGNSAILDGFTIRDGNANGASPYNNGGAMHNTSSSPMITNCIFTQNRANNGGAIYNITSSAPTINSCSFTSNISVVDGGAIHHISSTLNLANCTFTTNAAGRAGAVFLSSATSSMTNCAFTQNNVSDDGGACYFNFPLGSSGINNCNFLQNISTNSGGAIYINSANVNAATVQFSRCKFNNNSGNAGGAILNNISSAQFSNCEIAGNVSTSSPGGGVYNNNNSNSTLTNCTLTLNSSAGVGDGMYNNNNCDPVIKNCIIWNNGDGIINSDGTSTPVITYSIIQGNNSGGSIINADPLFVNGSLPNFDLHLTVASPAINQSDPATVSPVTDLDGVSRVGVFDMGAYEYDCSGSAILYVDVNVAGGLNNGISWANAYTSLQSALNHAEICPVITEIRVAQGSYKPSAYPNGCVGCSTSRDFSFHLKNGIKIYGGYPSGGGVRNVTTNVTTLSGDIGTVGSITDNVYHVVLSVGDGTNTILDGFTISGGNANAAGTITVESSSVSKDSGGGMYNHSSAPGIANCKMISNAASNLGGAMFNTTSSAPQITGCTFTGNSSVLYGGAIYHTSSTLNLTNCTFTTNSAWRGGAAFSSSCTTTMTNCTFTQNSASDDAGAWYSNIPLGSSAINNCNFTQNTATNGGGAIYVNSANANAATVHFIRCKINKNSGGAGGAIVNNISSSQFTNCEIAGNAALTSPGGGIYNNNTSSSTLTNCTLSLNTSVGSGDGIYNNINCDPVIKNCIIWNNGDGIFNNDVASVPVITYSIIQGNNNGGSIINADPLFVNGSLPNFDLHLNVASPAINQSDPATVSPVTDLDGVSRVGVFDMGAYEYICSGSIPTLYVDATATGGLNNGLSWANAYTSLQSALNQAHNCSNVSEIWVAQGTYKPTAYPYGCTGCTSNRDFSFHLKDGVKIYGGYPSGGGIRNAASNVTTLSGDIGTIGSNTDNVYHVVLSVSDGINTILDGFTISGGNANTAATVTVESNSISKDSGAGLYTYSSAPGIANCKLIFNAASNGGGAFYNTIGNPAVSGCSFTSNTALLGGGIYTVNSSPTFNSCSFGSNSASNNGGAIYNTNSNPTLTACIFEGNSANNGGGMYNANNSAAVLNGCIFKNNSVSNGGGMYNLSSNPVLTNCVFANNSNITNGGGIFNSSSSPSLTNCVFTNNSVNNNGGGIVNFSNSSPTMINCTVTNNAAPNVGGGLYNSTNSNPIVRNSIFWGNTGGGAQGIANNSSTPIVSYSIVQGGYSACTSCPGTNGNTNPLFVNGADPDGVDNTFRTLDDGLSLQFTSPAINASNPTTASPLTDVTGQLRNGIFDIGAYESAFTTPNFTLCPSNQNVVTEPALCHAALNYLVQAEGNPTPGFSYTFTGDLIGNGSGTGAGTLFPHGTTNVSITATNVNGTDVCAFTVTVVDNQDPVAPALSPLTGDCEVSVPVPTATDNCAGNILGTTNDPLFYTIQGTYMVTWTFDDGNGNVVNVDQDVIVDDITPPTLDCPTMMDVTLNTDCELVIPGEYYIPDPNISNAPMGWSKAFPANLPAYGSMGGLEPTGLVGWQNGAEAFPMAGDFVIEYNVTIYSAGGIGNGDCMFGYTKINPNPANLLVHGYSNDDQAVYVYFDQGYMISSLFGLTWDNPVSFNAVVGNTVTIRMQRTGTVISYLITGVGPNKMGIIEGNNPDLIYPFAVFYNVGCKLNYAKIISGSSARPVGQDNCSYVLTTDPPIGTTYNAAHNQLQTVEVTITDEGGNNETCNIDLIAKDLNKPVLTNPGNQTINAPLGTCQATLSLANPMTDNCSGGSWTYEMMGATTHSGSVANGTSLNYNSLLWGVTHIVLGATDAAGNTATEVAFDVTVNSITTEVCDLVDNNCNGLIDEGVLLTFYPDTDGDGYGSVIGSIQGCIVPSGYANNAADCDDGNFFINAGQAEICDGLDNNCNGWVDENLPCSNIRVESFDVPGLDTVVVPSGVTGISAQVWGGGAGGGSNGSGGGGGGAFRQGMIPVVLNQEIEFTIGDGGSGGNSGNASGDDGESSSIGSIVAGGGHASSGLSGGGGGSGSGGGGGGAGGGGGSGEGGGGGSGSGGGGGGGGGGASGAGGGGGSGGGSGAGSGGIGGPGGGGAPGGDAGGNGGNGAPGTGMPGTPGMQPGGGGGGGGNGADGGPGATGSIIIQFQCPVYNLNNISVANPSCSNGTITINSDILDLPAGQYNVRYNVSGDVTHNNQSSAMVVNTPGTGDFMLLTLLNGNYQITVTHIESGMGIVCSSEIFSNNTLVINIANVEICNNGIDDNCDGNIDEVGTLYRTIQSGDYYTDATWENGCPPPAIIPPGTMVKVLHPVINMGTITNNGDIVIQGGTFVNNGLYKGRGAFAGSMLNEGTIRPGN